jgi:hypothetical protein
MAQEVDPYMPESEMAEVLSVIQTLFVGASQKTNRTPPM